MDAENPAEWQQALTRLKQKAATAKKKKKTKKKISPRSPSLGKEALMTLVAIMKEQDDPRLQLSAAKTLLQQAGGSEENESSMTQEVSAEDVHAAIALAKKLLDELASRKAGGVSGPGEMASGGAG